MSGVVSPWSRRPAVILVVGLPRSGTTWAAKAIAEATRRTYVHEPFNWIRDPAYQSLFLRYAPAGAPLEEVVPGVRTVTRKGGWAKRLLVTPRLVVKEVHAILAVEKLWEELRSKVVIVVRHPCGVAASWSSIGFDAQWNLDRLLCQGDLIDGPLSPWASWLRSDSDPFFILGALWGAVHRVLAEIADRHPDWLWVSHERLCRDAAEFERLLESLNVGTAERDSGALHRFLARSNREPCEDDGPFTVARVTSREPGKWRDLLTEEQQKAVLDGARPFGWPAVLRDESLDPKGLVSTSG